MAQERVTDILESSNPTLPVKQWGTCGDGLTFVDLSHDTTLRICVNQKVISKNPGKKQNSWGLDHVVLDGDIPTQCASCDHYTKSKTTRVVHND